MLDKSKRYFFKKIKDIFFFLGLGVVFSTLSKKKAFSNELYTEDFFQPTTKYLLPTNSIRLIGLSKKVEQREIELTQKFIVNNFNIECIVPENIVGEDTLFINDDFNRAIIATEAINNTHSKFIWNIRGGYGSYRVMPYLSRHIKKNNNKIIIGYSDTTSLHSLLSQERFAMPSIHWENAYNIIQKLENNTLNEQVVKIFHNIITSKISKISYDNLVPINKPATIRRTIYGKITGGNISVIQASIGTSWQINTKNKILFLEDVEESFYKIDRMLQSFVQSGLLEHVHAIIIGNIFNSMKSWSRYMQYVLDSFAQSITIPVYRACYIGHECDNYPLIFMKDSEIISGEKFAKLTIDTSNVGT